MESELERLTENIYARIFAEKEKEALYYLLNENYKGNLDGCLYVVREYYKKFYMYNDTEWKLEGSKKELGKCQLNNESIECRISGEVLNSFSTIFKAYIGCERNCGKNFWPKMHIAFCENNNIPIPEIKDNSKLEKTYEELNKGYDEKEKNKYKESLQNVSNLAKMFFHLVTTVGNIMPWPKGFNPVTGGGIDIFQYKFSDKYYKINYWNLHDKDKQKENSKWVEIVIDKGNIDKKQYKEIELWKKSLVNVHYLQDFVNENETEALIFYDKTITDSNIRWNLYFYRASKAIMKRSYRILTKEDPNKDGKSKFDIEFSKFCKKYEVEEDVNNLTKYFNNKIKEIKNELEEMKALTEQL